ncbi:MAG: stage II sporulation protein M [Cyclobacteriaceae bacterium]
MKEHRFVEQNKDKWVKFEKLLDLDIKDPDKLSRFFIQITDDLSYARTFYNNRSIRVYLNNLCQQLFYTTYKSKRTRRNFGFRNFWVNELPKIAFESRRELLTALLIFVMAVCIGVVSSVYDPEFVKVILGDQYVEMTKENIQSGDPMAVYKKMNEVDMFLGITFNNLMVAVNTFLLGILYAIGAVIILINNGIMVGTFQYFFFEKGLFWDSFLTIWLHGTLEISSIVIAGAAGIVLGKGIISPGTYSRLQSFQIAAKKGTKLLLGIIPILTFAALIESFLTRYTDVPDMLRLALIVISLAFIIFYFIWYPAKVAKKNSTGEDWRTHNLQPTPDFNIKYEGIIKGTGEILKDVFLFYRKYSSKIMRVNIVGILLYLPGVLWILYNSLYTTTFSVNSWYLDKMTVFIDYQNFPVLYLINTIFFAGYITAMLIMLKSDTESEKSGKVSVNQWLIKIMNMSFLIFLAQACFFINGGWSILIFLILSPFILICSFVLVNENLNFLTAINRSLELLKGNYKSLLGLYIIIFLVAGLGYVFMNSPFPLFYLDFVQWNLPVEEETINMIMVILNSIISVFSLLVIIPLFLFAHSFSYFSFKEIIQADGLMASLNQFGNE